MDSLYHRSPPHGVDLSLFRRVGLLRRSTTRQMMKRIVGFFPWLIQSTKGHEFFFKGITTLILAAGAAVIMIPLVFMISTSLKDPAQIRSDANTLIPRKPETVEVNGERYNLYQ